MFYGEDRGDANSLSPVGSAPSLDCVCLSKMQAPAVLYRHYNSSASGRPDGTHSACALNDNRRFVERSNNLKR